jgi:2-keto-4-pentenoate hydratase/2-oxohepta-3-ene-1,7-dioic acid hydratase in catechol pathway
MAGFLRRIARVRPLSAAQPDEQFFVTSDVPDADSADGRSWTVAKSPFPGSPANASSPWRSGWRPGSKVVQDDFVFLAPSAPANVLGMAHNTGQAGRDLPPQAFHKAATSVVGQGAAIELAPGMRNVEPEAELAVVIGKKARGLTPDTARHAVLGFTIANDVTCRDLQKTDDLWISAKSQDTFTPTGPWIVTGLDERDLTVGVAVNGTALRTASTADLGWKVDEILVYLTSILTLHPGDLVLTGFPAQGVPLSPGDEVVCRVQGIGELANPVAESPWPGVPGGHRPASGSV